MDPVSAIGLIGTCFSITGNIASVGSHLQTIIEKYKDVRRTVSLMSSQLSALNSAAIALSDWLERCALSNLVLVDEIAKSLDACDSLVSILLEQVSKYEARTLRLNFWRKTKFLIDEDTILRYEGMLRGQVQALSLILQISCLPSAEAQSTTLISRESSRILRNARDDASSLLWLRDSESIGTYRSTMTENLETVDIKFDFDHLCLSSSVYRSALEDTIRDRIKRKFEERQAAAASAVDDAASVQTVIRKPESESTAADPAISVSETEIAASKAEVVDDQTEAASNEDNGHNNDDAVSITSTLGSIESNIDYNFVYANHGFSATIEGQVAVTKNQMLTLLDDSNNYWWLVRDVDKGTVGYVPAEYIETPLERLARRNKHLNIDPGAGEIRPSSPALQDWWAGKPWIPPKSVKFDETLVIISDSACYLDLDSGDEDDSDAPSSAHL